MIPTPRSVPSSKLAAGVSPIVTESKIIPPTPDCTTTYSSKYLKLSFQYDDCAWNLNENLLKDGSTYSTIIANHKSNHPLAITSYNTGYDEYFPDCYEVEGVVVLLEDNIVRYKLVRSPRVSENNPGQNPHKRYHSKYYGYLNSKHKYAIKGYLGEFGDKEFIEYFDLFNSPFGTDMTNTNMCWRDGRINTVGVSQSQANPRDHSPDVKDLQILIEEEDVSDKTFLMDADALAVSIFSSINK